MSSAKNEQYEVTNCELEHVNGEYIFNSKLDCHVHKSGKIHLYRTSKDYIWTIADSTRRKQYCFAQKIAPQPTGCSWNVYTGGVGAELLTSSMRVFNNTEIANASPLKKTSASKTAGKLSPMNTSLKPGPKLTSDKVSPLKPLTPVAPAPRVKSSSLSPVPTDTKTSPSFKAASATAAASAKQTIINISNNILGVSNGNGNGNGRATVVRKTEPKTPTPAPVSLQVSVPDQPDQNPPQEQTVKTGDDNSISPRSAIESEAISPRISPRASFERVPSSGGVSPLHRPSSRLSMFEQVHELAAVVLEIPSVDTQVVQVTVPTSAKDRLAHTQTQPAPTLTEWSDVERSWADSTVLLDREVHSAHQRIAELDKSLAERSADLEILRGLYEESQEQERVAREELHSQLALAEEAQDHFAQLREVEAMEEARDARAQAQEALLREQAALANEQTANERAEAALLQVEIARAHAREAHDQAEAAQHEAHEADEVVGALQEKLVLAHAKIAALETSLEETHALQATEAVTELQTELQTELEQANQKIALFEAAMAESQTQAPASIAAVPASDSDVVKNAVSDAVAALQTQLDSANEKIATLQAAVEEGLPRPMIPQASAGPVSPLDDESTVLRMEALEQSLSEKEAELARAALALQKLQERLDAQVLLARVVQDNGCVEAQDTTSTVTAASVQNQASLASHGSHASNHSHVTHVSHVLRDAPVDALLSSFPSGAAFQALFQQELAGFEGFVQDAVKCLEDLGHLDEAAEVLVNEVLSPMFRVCHECVNDNIEVKRTQLESQWGVEVSLSSEHDHTSAHRTTDAVELFWYTALQPLMLAEIDALSSAALSDLLLAMGETTVELEASMLTAGAAGVIDNAAGALRLPRLAHLLLRYFAIAALSDPRCVLYPAPGRHVPYQEHFAVEVSLSPSTNADAEEPRALAEGEEVEVVFCGVYFVRPAEGDFLAVKPVIPARVRRLRA